MRLFLLVVFVLNSLIGLFGQKPAVDTSVIGKWPYAGTPVISNDGNYATYIIENHPIGGRTLIIQGLNDNFKREIEGGAACWFSADSKNAIFQDGDTLFFLNLKSGQLTHVLNVSSFAKPQTNSGQWLAYHLMNSDEELILVNLITGGVQRFDFVKSYSFDNEGNYLVVETRQQKDSVFTYVLQWINLRDEKRSTIWVARSLSESDGIVNFSFDAKGNQLAFLYGEGKIDRLQYSLWYYKVGMDKAVLRANDTTPGIEAGFSIGNSSLQFSKNGQWIFFRLQHVQNLQAVSQTAAKVNIWSYRDLVLQSEQLSENPLFRKTKEVFMAVVNANGSRAIRLEHDDETVDGDPSYINGDFVVVSDKVFSETWWQSIYGERAYYLVSLHDGSRTLLKRGGYYRFYFSPSGRYVIYYDVKLTSYFSYDVVTARSINISKSVPARLSYGNENGGYIEIGIAGWVKGDTALLVYDDYDIWQIDPLGVKKPFNIFSGYGRLHHLKLRFVYETQAMEGLSGNDTLILTAFNTDNKYNGFYRKVLGVNDVPEMLSIGPYTFYHADTQKPFLTEHEDALSIRPIKARDSRRWIVERMSATDAPNYYVTSDFKAYFPLTNIQPQANYNWLTTELIKWKQFDGTMSEGILYKPENFDRSKKYPVIFYYYEKVSHCLFEFPTLAFTQGPINIPWFVSHGYLVFRPDVHYTIGKSIRQDIYNSVVSAAQVLAKRPWVDSGKMGVQGHSFGGHETNDLITSTHLFAAAAEAAGVSDVVSSALSLNGPLGKPIGARGAGGQGRIIGTISQSPSLYIDCSAVFWIDRITTPLLIMHNMSDPAVPWGQGVEMFLAMRRVGKKVWMLQYDDGTHAVSGKDAVDYTLRLTQFFDYYLKNALPPIWMTEGIPAVKKGIESGLDLDNSGRIP